MDFAVVLSHLQNQFSGQLVLYVDDLAKVLGKSDKAISNLIARKNLPFKIKNVGGQRCVDIFQVAQWLASDAQVAGQVTGESAKAPKDNNAGVASVAARKGKRVSTRAQGKIDSSMSPMSLQILGMRHDFGALLGRLFNQASASDELLFVHELSELLFYSGESISSSFVATIKKRSPTGSKILGQDTTRFFCAQAPAIDYLVAQMYIVDRVKTLNPQQFELKHLDEILLQVVRNGGKWIVLNNKAEVAELSGLW